MKPVNLSLKNGDSHELQSVNIFIGPNNSGKSLLLREIQSTYGVTKLFDEIHFDSIPDVDHIKSLMDETSQYNVFRSGNSISLQNWENAKQYIENDSIRQTHWEKHYRHNSVILNGRERLSIVNNQSYKGATAAPENSFSMLRTNQNLKDKVQKYISNVYPNDYFCLWNESQGSLTAYLAQEEPENNMCPYDNLA